MITPDLVRLSPNFGAGVPTGRLVVIHATRSGVSMNPTEFEGTLNWFARADVGLSAHWVIARDGRKARVVENHNRAVHAGEHNLTAWGIELEQGVEADGFATPQIAALVAVCRGYVADFGVEPVHTLDATQSGFIGHQETPQGKRVGKCIAGQTMLLASVRNRTIYDTADNVLKHDQVRLPCYGDDGQVEWRPIFWKKRTRRRVMKLQTYSGREILATPEHKWIRAGHRGNLYTGQVGGFGRKPILITTSKLASGHLIPAVDRMTREHVDERSIYNGEIGYFIGVYLAEGSILKRHARRLSLGPGDVKYMIPRLHAVLTGDLNEEWRQYSSKKSKSISIHLYGKVAAAILDKFIAGHTSHDKRLTQATWQQPLKFIAGLLDGYLDGDGHRHGNTWTVKTTYNPGLHQDLAMCALLLGRRCHFGGEGTATANGKIYRTLTSNFADNEPQTEHAIEYVSPGKEPGVFTVWDVQVGGNGLFVLGNGLVTHNSDPGALFPWEAFIAALTQEEKDMIYVRQNGVANPAFWEPPGGFTIAPGADQGMDAAFDFGLPPEAARVEVMVFRDPGTGRLVALDGGTGADAGRVVGEYGVVAPFLDGGWCSWRAEGAPVVVRRFAILGYWRRP